MKFEYFVIKFYIKLILVPAPEPECRVDSDCPSRLACLNEVCRNPCTTLNPCGVNAECTVQNTLPQRTMVCMCRPGYIGDADVACNLRKIVYNIFLFYYLLYNFRIHCRSGRYFIYIIYIDGIPYINCITLSDVKGSLINYIFRKKVSFLWLPLLIISFN